MQIGTVDIPLPGGFRQICAALAQAGDGFAMDFPVISKLRSIDII
jgi:hypothetical protein